MNEIKKPTLIVVCGWPFSGKTTLATALREELGVHHVDIDEVRTLMVGLAHPHPNESQELMKRDGQEMAMSYRLLLAGAHENLAAGRPLIITATFSRKVGQQMLLELMAKHTDAQLRIIQCVPRGDTDEEVARRMASRKFGQGAYMGAVNSVERYKEVKARYDRIELPHLEMPTWGSGITVQDEISAADDYIVTSDELQIDLFHFHPATATGSKMID